MTLRRVTSTHGIRGRPKCGACEADIKDLIIRGYAVYRKKVSARKGRNYYCAECKSDLFEGVKLRKEI